MKKNPCSIFIFSKFWLNNVYRGSGKWVVLFVCFGFDLCSFRENDEDGREFKVIRFEVEEDLKIEDLSSNLKYTTFYLLDLWP